MQLAKQAAPVRLSHEFDEFLYSQISDDDGRPTTVLTALARLDLDAWQVASRLAALPKDRAVQDLGLLIAQRGSGWQIGDIRSSVDHLPDRRRSSTKSVSYKDTKIIQLLFISGNAVFFILLCISMLFLNPEKNFGSGGHFDAANAQCAQQQCVQPEHQPR